MSNKPTPDMRLKQLARRAILHSKGDTDKARETFNLQLIEANDAALERCLCEAYRNTAIRALLATHFHELRAEGKLPELRKEATKVRTTDYDTPRERPQRPSDFLWSDTEGMTPKAIIRRYLDTFLVNGKPIGDCLVNEVDQAANAREADVRFMRGLVEGLPPNVTVRSMRSDEDATKIWEMTR